MHALEPALESIKREFDLACSQLRREARSQVVHELNQLLRRFRQYRTEGDWIRVVLDGAAVFAHQFALFSLRDDALYLRGQVHLDLPDDLSFPLAQAPAFANVCQLKDPVTCLRTPSEVTSALSDTDTTKRAHLFPITNGSRAAAILFAADDEDVDVSALELVAGLASSMLERQSNAALHSHIAPLQPTAPPNGHTRRSLPAWAELPSEQRQTHLRAQRFARVTVAEMQLSRPEACRAGREQASLYLFFKKEIDKARETYRKQFMTTSAMVDYFHLELVRTAAEGDEFKLGVDYPGQLA